jgi:hypothetical protein
MAADLFSEAIRFLTDKQPVYPFCRLILFLILMSNTVILKEPFDALRINFATGASLKLVFAIFSGIPRLRLSMTNVKVLFRQFERLKSLGLAGDRSLGRQAFGA